MGVGQANDNSQNEHLSLRKRFVRPVWNILALPIGYIVAVLIIFCFSRRSQQGYRADLFGKFGRDLAKEWGDAILIAFILAMFIRTFFYQAFRIPSGSMRMTLIEGDRLLVNKITYGALLPFTKYRLPGISHPKRGDIVVFKYPEDPKRDFIKRLIAVGGEVVEIKFGDIYINGKLIEDPVIKNVYYYNRGTYGDVNKKVSVPIGYYFVLGDNSGSSADSRYWGFVPQESLIGKAELIYWPLNRVRFLK
ncbi:MAG: signal peptidase I [Candidatus Omnitrophica bacterium]|nr:signal peptidase I [Candidatus Omnitrophota bacterium]